ncbi:DUF1648 domain-containing protein [Spongiivirga citrea]|uniref:DUF1648 domain-containing protein n=1 Tax=Spongiivirga citrea TaxID=1481457 RepID=A0A6M0CEA3_9FLAO|nr:DUF1648 domain-containing protein [Spongiivirga citrea]NER16145.1 DUF1648 domain-containing protein [Spongiivirga citrea]
MDRPKIKIEKDVLDVFLETLGLAFIIIILVLPIVYYNQLPEKIPTHFGADGTADDFGSKSSIWLLPILGTVMFFGLFMLNKYPHIFNYPQKITAENAKKQYQNATKLIRFLNTSIALVFAYITYSTINVAIGKQSGLGSYFLIAFLVLIFIPIFYFLYRSIPKK